MLLIASAETVVVSAVKIEGDVTGWPNLIGDAEAAVAVAMCLLRMMFLALGQVDSKCMSLIMRIGSTRCGNCHSQ